MYLACNLDVENQIQKIMNKVKLSDLDNKNLTDDLFDITDGSIYKKLLESEDGHLFANKKPPILLCYFFF
jgi:hypothetical protein